MKRGTIEPPMAENRRTTNVDTVFIWAELPDKLATKSAIEDAKAAEPMQAKTRAKRWGITPTPKAI